MIQKVPVDRTVWVSVVDFLRFSTPIVGLICTILSFIIIHFLNGVTATLDDNTKALNLLNTQIALVLQKQDDLQHRIEDDKIVINSLTTQNYQNSADIKVLYSKLQIAGK